MAHQDLGKSVAEIGGQREIAPFIKLLRREARLLAVHLAAFRRAAQHKHGIGGTVIGADCRSGVRCGRTPT